MLTQIISANSFFRSAMVCALLFSAVAHARSSDTEEGWARLVENKDENAIAAFTKALNANPSDARASMGMTYAYWLRLNHKKSWEHFKSAISNSSNPHAYLYAGVSSERYGYGTADPQSGAAELWKEILKNPDANGVMRAMAYEHLGFMADRDGDVEGAKQWYSKVGAITSWRMIGPFHNISASGHNKAFQPELTDDPSGKYEGESGCAVHWFQPKVVRNDSWMDFTEYFPWADGVYYSVVYVKSAAAQRVHFRLGTSGAYKLFLNDSLVGETIDEFNNDLDTYNYVVSLPAGWSKVLVKIDNSELDRSNFLFRITDSVGVALEGLEYTTQPQLYSHQNPNAVQLENSFINYFKQQIKQHPDYLENRLLLAEAYLRNDNVIDAQQVLGEILKQHPDFICALTLLADSYRRGRRSDDLVTTIERITTLRPDLPTSIVYKFYRALQSDRMDDAESMLSEIQTALPRSTDYYETAIRVARQKNEIAQVNTLTKSAFQDHPDNYAFASACMSIALMSEGRHAEALQIADKHLKARYSAAGLAIKGRIYLNDGRVSDWEDMFKKVLELNPANVAIYSEMSGTYTMRKDYAKAIEAVKQALEIAPTNSSYWFELGTLYRSQNNKPDAIDCMKKAIEFNPSYFSAREALRDLMEQPAPLTLVTPYNIDSLMASSPDADAFPDDDAIYLLDDESRVVLDGSRCEVLYETLVKVFTKDGIDRFKEMSLPGGSNSAIEKAVVRKANGREIPADVENGQAVFKGLEEGDFIYIKVKDKEYRVGKLAKYFNDSYLFNAFLPVKVARYSLLVPNSTSFRYNLQHSTLEPVITETDAGTMYMWQIKDLPAVEYEEGMPSINEVGMMLQVTSVKDWSEIVDWYYDIAATKTRATSEIKEVVDSLVPANSNMSKRKIIEEVYRYITTNIRYSNVPFRQSGIVPQKARDVLLTRIGDCKDVATLCISMLAERGITAYHVLVDTYTSPLSKSNLPSDDFDHAIVLVDDKDFALFLDLTADDVPVGSLPNADMDALALVIKPGWKIPSYLQRSIFTPSNVHLTSDVVLNSDLSASITQTFVNTGSRTQYYRSIWKDATQKEIEKQMNEWLSQDFADAKLDKYELHDLDTLSSTLTYSMSFTVKNFASEAGQFLMLKLPWFSPCEPVAALSYEKRTYPYELWKGVDTLQEVVNITVPTGYEIVGSQPSVKHSNNIAEYALETTMKGTGIDVSRRMIYKGRVVMPNEYQDYKSFYNDAVRSDRQSLLLAPLGTVVKTPAGKKATTKKK